MSRLAPKQVGLVTASPDMPTGGAVALGALRAEQHRALTVNQTTAGQAITLPAPVDATVIFGLDVHNIGSASFTLYGVTVTAGASARYSWNGTAYSADVAPTANGSTVEILTPSGQNAVPDVAVAPKAGSSAMFFVNGALATAGVSMDAAGVITVDPVALGYNVETVDRVTVVYYT